MSLHDKGGSSQRAGFLSRLIGSPYGARESMGFLIRHMTGPAPADAAVPFLAQEAVLNEITPRVSVAFVGDMFGLRDHRLQFSEELATFVGDADYLVVNLEGIAASSGRRLPNAQWSTFDAVRQLTMLKPAERTVLTVANNHAADHGSAALLDSIDRLSAEGFAVIGHRQRPQVVLGGQVALTACTAWSNKPTSALITLDDIHPVNAAFNILCPHWGFELELAPRPAMRQRAVQLIGDWPAIIGHHPHVPQPITSIAGPDGEAAVVAHSLGDFVHRLPFAVYDHGMAVRLELGPDSVGNWRIGRLTWRFVRIRRKKGRTIDIGLETTCPLFD